MKPDIRVDLLIPPENDNFVAEGVIDNECIIILSQEDGFESLDLEILPRSDGKPWILKYDTFIDVLNRCRNRLQDKNRK